MAAVLACGEGAVLSHQAAAALHGLMKSGRAVIDVTVPQLSPVARRRIVAHRRTTLTAADRSVVSAIPVTSVSRTLLDLAGARVSNAVLERACEQAVLEGLFDARAMSELLRRSKGVRGIRRLRRVLAQGDLGENVPASGLERRFRDLCTAAGLPAPEINRYILLGDEYHKVDFLWREQRVVVEVDGAKYHETGWQRHRDAHRDSLLTANRYGHTRVSEAELDTTPAEAIIRVRSLFRRR
jgi:hypothetical protein